MKKIIFKGCGTAIVTPFNENGVDFEEFKKLIGPGNFVISFWLNPIFKHSSLKV